MSTLTIDGILAGPLTGLRALVARCPSFQRWVGAADHDAALPRIHLLETIPDPPLPLALIDLGDGFERERITLGVGRPFAQRGALMLYLQEVVPGGADELAAALGFCCRMGQVWAELETQRPEPGGLVITGINLAVAPTRIASERRDLAGDTYEAALSITWQATH